MERQVTLSMIIPAYNAGSGFSTNVKRLFDYLSTRIDTFEIIIVDDGSTDGFPYSCNEIPCTYFLQLNRNEGKGAALRTGFKKSKGHFVIFIDSDLPYELTDIDSVLYYLQRGFHIVIGDRTLPASITYKTQFNRKLMSWAFSKFTTMVITGGLPDTQCGLKGFLGNIGRSLFSLSCIKGFAIDVEILYIALKYCLDIKRVPVHLKCQTRTSIHMLKEPFRMSCDVLRLKLYYQRGLYKDDSLVKQGLPHLSQSGTR